MMTEKEIKTCPFCGAKCNKTDCDYLVVHKTGCLLRDIKGENHYIVSDRALEQWNRRADEQEYRDVQNLRRALDECKAQFIQQENEIYSLKEKLIRRAAVEVETLVWNEDHPKASHSIVFKHVFLNVFDTEWTVWTWGEEREKHVCASRADGKQQAQEWCAEQIRKAARQNFVENC